MTAVVLPQGKQQYFTAAGIPLAGGKLYTFDTGTSTPRTTWLDAAQIATNANPIILDARGEAAVFWSGAYRVRLEDSLGNVIWGPIDGIASDTDSGVQLRADLLNSASGGQGAALVGFNPALTYTANSVGAYLNNFFGRTAEEISAGVTPLNYYREPLDPRRYAAVANWTAVYNQINTLAESYYGWYRGDRAQHIALTNTIIGLGAYHDEAMTGTLGYRCVAIGVDTLKLNNTSTLAGGSNVAVGYQSMRDSVDTSGNTGVGTSTLASCTGLSSSHNGAFGNSALEALVSGTQNNGFAYRAMYQLVSGSNNTAAGDVCLGGLLNGANANTCYGALSGFTKPSGNYLHAFGYTAAFHETSALVSAITRANPAVITLSTVSAANPFAVNDYVMVTNAGGMTQINEVAAIVTAIGGASGAWTVTVAIDSSAFTVYTTGAYLSPVGNTAFGYKNQFENVYASGNSTFGFEVASTAVMGIANSIFGFQAGRVINGATLNSIFGWRAGLAMISGASNCLFGQQAGIAITTGGSNVCIGGSAGNAISTGSNNTSVGTGTGTANGSNRTCLGFNAQSSADNQVNLGDTNVTQLRAQVTVITAYSDERLKRNVETLEIPDGFLEEVRVVAFNWRPEKFPDGVTEARQIGVIAQELDQLQKKYDVEWLGLVSTGDDGIMSATPHKLLFPLIQKVQQQSKLLENLAARVAALEAR